MGAMKVTELVQQIVDLVLERQLGEDSDRFRVAQALLEAGQIERRRRRFTGLGYRRWRRWRGFLRSPAFLRRWACWAGWARRWHGRRRCRRVRLRLRRPDSHLRRARCGRRLGRHRRWFWRCDRWRHDRRWRPDRRSRRRRRSRWLDLLRRSGFGAGRLRDHGAAGATPVLAPTISGLDEQNQDPDCHRPDTVADRHRRLRSGFSRPGSRIPACLTPAGQS